MSKPVNKLKEPVSVVEEKVQEEPKKPEKSNKMMRSVASVVSGSFLSKETTLKNLPFIFFLSFLAICYIANGYYADDQVRKVNRLNNEIKELRTQYIVSKDSLVIKSKQTEIAKVLVKQQTGIKESVVPPKKIVIKTTATELKEE
jgi:hypothetical protein